MDKDKFKIVYVAPMKALVKEMVDSFGKVGHFSCPFIYISIMIANIIETEALRYDSKRTQWRCQSDQRRGRFLYQRVLK